MELFQRKGNIMKKLALLTSILALAACGGGSGGGHGGAGGIPGNTGSNTNPDTPSVQTSLSNLTAEQIELAKNLTDSQATVNNADDLIARVNAVYGSTPVSEGNVSRSASRRSSTQHDNDELKRAEQYFENARKMLGDKEWFQENFEKISESDFAKACQLLNVKFENKQDFFNKLNDQEFWNRHHHDVNSANNKLTIEDMYTGGFSMGDTVYHCEGRVKDFYANADEAKQWLDAYGLNWDDITDDTEFSDIEKNTETTRLLVDKKTGEIYFATYYAPGTNLHYEVEGDNGDEIQYLQIAQGTNGCIGAPCDCSSRYGCLFKKDTVSNISDFKNGTVTISSDDGGKVDVTFHNNKNQDNIGLKYSDILSVAIFEDGELDEINMHTMGYDSKQIDMEKLAKNKKVDKKLTYTGKALGVFDAGDGWTRIQDKNNNTVATATLEFDPNNGVPTETVQAKFSELGWYDVNVTKQYGTDGFDMELIKTDSFEYEDVANGLTYDKYVSESSPEWYNVRYYGDKSSVAAEEVVGRVHGSFKQQNNQGGSTNNSLEVEFSFGAIKD